MNPVYSISVKEGRRQGDHSLPLVLECVEENVDFAQWAREHRVLLDQQLWRDGGILFRGFQLSSAEEFERAAAALCDELYGEYGDLPGESGAGKVYSSTPYPENESILFHNESSHLTKWPSKICFFCMIAAKEGGATPIVDCRRVYRDLNPSVREEFERKGLMYVRNFHEGLDVSWQQFFGTEDKAAVEESCRRDGMTCAWTGENNLRISQRCPAVLRHPRTGELTFFNQVQLHHVNCLPQELRQALLDVFEPDQLPRHVYYGDGSSIENATMDHVGEVYEKNAVRFGWNKGDLVCLDNMLTAHGRDPYAGERKILVALGDMVSN